MVKCKKNSSNQHIAKEICFKYLYKEKNGCLDRKFIHFYREDSGLEINEKGEYKRG